MLHSSSPNPSPPTSRPPSHEAAATPAAASATVESQVTRAEFLDQTRAMLIQLNGAPLLTEAGLSLWRLLLHEYSSVAESQTMSERSVHLLPVFQLSNSLPVPEVIRAGLQREHFEWKQSQERNKGDQSSPFRRSVLRAIEKRTHGDQLWAKHRTPTSVANTITEAFHNTSLSRFYERHQRRDSSGTESPSNYRGITITPNFQMVGDHDLGFVLKPEEAVLQSLYHDSAWLPGTVILDYRKHKVRHVAELQRASTVLAKLGGEIPEARAEVLDRFGGEYPVFIGREREMVSNSGLEQYCYYQGLRTAIGDVSLKASLLRSQSQIESGELCCACYELQGRIHPEFLKWLDRKVYDGVDPIPDVEILYALLLPSGGLLRFVLKAAANYTRCQSVDRSSLSPSDLRLVDSLSLHFLMPDHRKQMDLLTSFRRGDYPDDLRELLANSVTIGDLRQVQRLQQAWIESIWKQLLQSGDAYDRVYPRQYWTHPSLSDPDLFESHSRELLVGLPDRHTEEGGELFRLTAAELEEFIPRYVPIIHQLCNSERQRIATEDLTRAHERRLAIGYRGPKEGYGLPLDYMYMDMLIDYRKRRQFLTKLAQTDPEAAARGEIPDHIGRRYDRPHRFIGIDGLPAKLHSMQEQGYIKRVAQLRLFDPLSDSGIVEFPIAERHRLERHVLETNHQRFNPVLQAYWTNLRAVMERAKLATWEKTSAVILRRLHETSVARLTQELQHEVNVEERRKAELAELHSDLKRRGIFGEDRKTAIDRVKERYSGLATAQRQAVLQAFQRLDFIYSSFLVGDYYMRGLRGDSIIDREVVAFIYSIPAYEEPILSEEFPATGKVFRYTHSEHLGGRNSYGSGRLVLARHEQIFHSVGAWENFNSALSAEIRDWFALTLDDSTGHYHTLADGLPYSGNVISPRLRRIGIDTSRMRLVDCLAPGLKMRGSTNFPI